MKRLLALIATLTCLPAHAGFDLTRPEIQEFITEVAARDHLSRRKLTRLLAKAEPQAKIIERTDKPAEHVLEWWEYRAHFLTEKRIADGTQFWLDHREALERTARERGVAPEFIVAILGCETAYGRIMGNDRVLDALMTLAFDYPARGDFFRKELEQFVLLTREEKIDPLKVMGSYAGAMGAVQFMPSTYRQYAVDADGDGHPDLWKSWDDIFASIANYFRAHGWQPAGPVLADARLDPDPDFQINPRNLELNTTVGELNAHGVHLEGLVMPDATPAVLISAEQEGGPAYRVGLQNFYVITRYNHNARYAMAVNDLAEAVAARVAAAQHE